MSYIKNKKIALIAIVYIVLLIIVFVIWRLVIKVNFTPLINNVIVFSSIFVVLTFQIFVFWRLLKSKIRELYKIILAIIIIIIFGISVFFASILVLLDTYIYKDFDYEGKTYYIEGKGSIDLSDPYMQHRAYVKKDFWTMKVLSYNDIEKIFKLPKKIEDDEIREYIEDIIRYNIKCGDESQKVKTKSSNADIEDILTDSELPQDVLKKFSVDYAIKIDHSSYGIVKVNSAMHRSQWFFVNIAGNNMIYISEIPDTSPSVVGEVDEKGIIYLECEDVNGNITKYKSQNNGLTWELTK
ncbi:MAG: hypothetical protein PUI85_05290 [Eubacteriales bacterium]|nr:hypothetical protein [Eubacteriales bacterium]MDY3332514.1 hypothetical protein [Gallibacter sp.]